MIAKAKRLERKRKGLKVAKGRKIPSRPFRRKKEKA